MDEFNRLLADYADCIENFDAADTLSARELWRERRKIAREALTEWVRLRVEREPDGWAIPCLSCGNVLREGEVFHCAACSRHCALPGDENCFLCEATAAHAVEPVGWICEVRHNGEAHRRVPNNGWWADREIAEKGVASWREDGYVAVVRPVYVGAALTEKEQSHAR